MTHAWPVAGTIGWTVALAILLRAHGSVRRTMLRQAWGWAIGGLGLWGIAWSATVLLGLGAEALADHLWYAVAVVMLCPGIAVLGARRPGARVWTWFVLLPLVLVFAWPALAAWTFAGRPQPLHLQTPMLLGYILVLVMGTGNYVGTRFTFPALLASAGLSLLALSVRSDESAWLPDAEAARVWATWLVIVAVLLALVAGRRPLLDADASAERRLNALWRDVRDAFGIVWATRLQERVNETARRENWPCRLHGPRLVWTAAEVDPAARAAALGRLDETLRWLLRRFVDPPWIDERLRSTEDAAPRR